MASLSRLPFCLCLVIACGLSMSGKAGAGDENYEGVKAGITPFDSRYRRIQRYLDSEEQRHQVLSDSETPFNTKVLKKYLRIANSFRYRPDKDDGESVAGRRRSRSPGEDISPEDRWQLPEETESRGAGDCEDKAIWLYARLLQMGFENVRLVVGKYRLDQPAYHAWVVCYGTNRIYILDPTMNGGLWPARHYPKGFYRPLYSYSKGSRWRHSEPSR